MRPAPMLPRVHVFVCANRRAASDPLGEGCGARGDAVFDAFKAEIARRGDVASTWITRTHCLGLCPRVGTSVALYPRGEILTEVTATDVPQLLARAAPPASEKEREEP